jgi:alcohol dehydrogenase
MKAAQFSEYGTADVIKLVDVPTPEAKSGQVLIEVYATSINPIDEKVREGALAKMVPLQLPVTLGTDVAGIVTGIGEGVTGFESGDRVYGMAGVLRGATGAMAEFAATPADAVAHMPRDLDFTAAAASALVGVSAWQALHEHFKLKRGERILIHGGAGGIGAVAIQIARQMGLYVATTATGDGVAFTHGLGADQVIDYKIESFDRMLSGFDAVYDTIGGDTYARSFRILKPGGMIVSMVMPADADLMKQFGVTAIYQQTQVNTAHLDALTKLIEQRVVKVPVGRVFPFDQLRQAFAAKDEGQTHGKIAIEIRK